MLLACEVCSTDAVCEDDVGDGEHGGDRKVFLGGLETVLMHAGGLGALYSVWATSSS